MPAKRIAVVDDSEIVLEVVASALTDAGFEVVATSQPNQRELLGGGSVDLILIDVNMPEVLGDDLPSFFRDAWGITAPAYLFSDLDEAELRARAEQSGAAGYICKSWGTEELVRRISEAVGQPQS